MGVQASSQATGVENVVDEEEDFYGYENSANGIASENVEPTDITSAATGTAAIAKVRRQLLCAVDQLTPSDCQTAAMLSPATNGATANSRNSLTPSLTPSVDYKKLETQKKTEELRAKLMAQRQNTPGTSKSRANTPVKNATTARTPNNEFDMNNVERPNKPSSNVFDLESLLAEGRAAAEAKMREQNATATATSQPKEQATQAASTRPTQTAQTDAQATGQIKQLQANQPATASERPKWSTKLTDAYNDDLPIWLEMTGYHDVEYRNSKLHTYKERKTLEEEAARIQLRLEKLRQAEQANIESLRTAGAHQTTTDRPPPALPATMPNGNNVQPAISSANTSTTSITTGTKRAHSPDATQVPKVRRENAAADFSIRGANGAPDNEPRTMRCRPRSRSPVVGASMECRISDLDARRLSLDNYGGRGAVKREDSRDPSLERRQSYYKRELNPGHRTKDRFEPRGAYEGRGRISYSNVNVRDVGENAYRDYPQQYRESSWLDLRRGGKPESRWS